MVTVFFIIPEITKLLHYFLYDLSLKSNHVHHPVAQIKQFDRLCQFSCSAPELYVQFIIFTLQCHIMMLNSHGTVVPSICDTVQQLSI